MFDTPDLMPLCVAPFVAIFVGVLIYGIAWTIGYFVERKTGKKFHWGKPTILFFAIFVVPIACIASVALQIGTREPAPWFSPNDNNIVGKWELTRDKIEYLEKWNNIPVLPHEFVFNSDGTFHVTNIPTFWGLWDETNKKWVAQYMSGSGIWHLGQIEGTERLEWVVFVQFQEIDGQKTDTTNQVRLVRFYFVGHLPPYILRSMDGDLGFDIQKK